MTDDVVIDTFCQKLAPRVRYRGTIARSKRDGTARWSRLQSAAFIFAAGYTTWMAIFWVISLVAKARGMP